MPLFFSASNVIAANTLIHDQILDVHCEKKLLGDFVLPKIIKFGRDLTTF